MRPQGMNLFVDNDNPIWDELVYQAGLHGIDLRNSIGCNIDIRDIEPDVPSYEDFREVDTND